MARPTEVKAITALLEAPADDVVELAKAIIQTLDDLRAQRSHFTVVTQYKGGPDVWTWANGLFATRNQAAKAVETGKIHTLRESRSMIVEVRPIGPALPQDPSVVE